MGCSRKNFACASIVFLAMVLLLFSRCGKKADDNITFTAIIDSIEENSIMVTTVDFDGFDRANVGYAKDIEFGFNLIVGQKINITILPEIRESYPVQVTAVKMKLAN